ncbi:MAG: hypothetical protein ACI8RD_007299 [Bacillariaceae sp.]|jgi:hypothetical protein
MTGMISYISTTTLLLVVVVAVITTTTRCSVVTGFTPPMNKNYYYSTSSTTKLYEIIEAQTEDYVAPEEGAGGVALAKESAIKIIGEIKHKPGQAESLPETLLRYNNLQTVDESTIQDVLKKVGGGGSSTIICKGQGVELYKNPGETTISEVNYGPTEAIKDAFTNAASCMESTNLIFNFLGGDDLMLGEVMEAASELVVMLDIPTNAKISFNSLSYKTIPSGTCAVTVVSVPATTNDESSSFSGVEKAISLGEVYSRDGSWYTVEESDINTEIA